MKKKIYESFILEEDKSDNNVKWLKNKKKNNDIIYHNCGCCNECTCDDVTMCKNCDCECLIQNNFDDIVNVNNNFDINIIEEKKKKVRISLEINIVINDKNREKLIIFFYKILKTKHI